MNHLLARRSFLVPALDDSTAVVSVGGTSGMPLSLAANMGINARFVLWVGDDDHDDN